MSATGRGSERIESDAYPTPGWCVRRLLEAAPWSEATPECPGGNWGARSTVKILEPCAGEGAIIRELRSTYPSAFLAGYELRQGRPSYCDAFADETDALAEHWTPFGRQWDLVLTNPPFSLWHEFAEKSLKASTWTALLLRMGAAAHLEGLPTPSLYILPDRPIFAHKVSFSCGDSKMIPWNAATPRICGNTDGCWSGRSCGGAFVKRRAQSDASEYAWLVWGPQAPTVHILAKTPLAERKQPTQLQQKAA